MSRPENRRYGQWAGDPKGQAEDTTRCVEEVAPPPAYIFRQCSRARGHGPDDLWCSQHGKQAAASLLKVRVREPAVTEGGGEL